MKGIRWAGIGSVALAAVGASLAQAQNPPPGFGTPQGTNTLAASAGFIDIVGIKLGMPAEEALAKLKASYPSAKITLKRTADYESAWYSLDHENPNHKWVCEIEVDANGEHILVGLSLPPSKQVVDSIGRQVNFQEPVAVENIVAGLRKKYGDETYGVDDKLGRVAAFDQGNDKTIMWVYDAQGKRVKPAVVTNNPARCALSMGADSTAAALITPRPHEPAALKDNPCFSLVILNAAIQTVSPARGINGQVRSFEVTAFDWPLITSGAYALYAFLDQGARDLAAKQAADAKKRGGDVKY